jgi:hypothetical protein
MMLRTPRPELAMTLAEDHRRNLMASAGNRPTGATGNPNARSFLCIFAASLGRLAHSLEATLARFQTASNDGHFSEPFSGQRVGRSSVEVSRHL